jgi:predicted house-cleaning noncanonical NTP pyrophosphatase (MazG superfamily)
MQYKKLVRDKIPQIILKKGKLPTTHTATKQEYRDQLKQKLQEETNEFITSEKIEELADLLEVIYALAKAKKTTPKQLESLRQKKAKARGAFTKQIILDEVK